MKRKLIIGSIILLSAIINTNIEALADDENEYPIGSGPSLRLENDECICTCRNATQCNC